MPRHVRIEYEGAIYHVMNRGDHFENIVRDVEDYGEFLRRLEETCQRHEWSVHAFVIMRNHYHLMIETHRASLVRGMQYLNGSYTQGFNRRHKLRGHLFQGRYKALLVDGGHPGYLRTVADYIHMNPVRAHVVKDVEGLLKWRWCSAGWLAGSIGGRPEWLRWERVFGEHGWQGWDARTRQRYRDALVRRVSEEMGKPADYGALRRGWCYGADAFREKMKECVGGLLRGKRRPERWTGLAVSDTEEDRAERLLEAMVKRMGASTPTELTAAQKMIVAMRLREACGVKVRWLVDRLKVGTESGLRSGMVYARRKMNTESRGPYAMIHKSLDGIFKH